jgi:DNA-directed RNA polymerase specialized sigma24 family protein
VRLPASTAGRRHDSLEEVALVACARRELLLRAHRHRLRREDLEDCFSQATLELLRKVREGGHFASRLHVANALELRFVSRVHDRRRALSGRSAIQAALELGTSLDEQDEVRIELADHRFDPELLALLRDDLRRVRAYARALSPDQRLVLASQIDWQTTRAEFCERFGWSPEKYRKTAQRARARLRILMVDGEPRVPPSTGASDESPRNAL